MPTSARTEMEMNFPSLPPPRAFVPWLPFLQVPIRGQRQLPVALPCPSRVFLALQLHRLWSSRRWPPSSHRQPSAPLPKPSSGQAVLRGCGRLQPRTSAVAATLQSGCVRGRTSSLFGWQASWPWRRGDVSGSLLRYRAPWKEVAGEQSLAGCASGWS